MPGVRQNLDMKAIASIKKSPGVVNQIRKQVRELARRANSTLQQNQQYPDYDWSVKITEHGVRGKVFTRSNHAKLSNARNQTITRLL